MSGTITTDHAAKFCNERHDGLFAGPHCRDCGDGLVRCTCEAWVHNLGEHDHDAASAVDKWAYESNAAAEPWNDADGAERVANAANDAAR